MFELIVILMKKRGDSAQLFLSKHLFYVNTLHILEAMPPYLYVVYEMDDFRVIRGMLVHPT